MIGFGMLTGKAIEEAIAKGEIEITPYNPSQINPNSYNLKLHSQLKVYKHGQMVLPMKYVNANNEESHNHIIQTPLRMDEENPTEIIDIPEEGYILLPNTLYLGRTVEKTSSDYYIPMINGRSSGGRLGISIHVCAGFGDIGFSGTWTLEITVVEPVLVKPNMELAQVCFFTPAGDASNLYRGRYYNQEEATPSRFHLTKGDTTK